MERRNEPLLLRPAGKDYLWGGKRLNDEYGKNIELSPLAETWECSTHPDGVSTVCCGTFDKRPLKYYSLLQLFAKYNFVPVEWYKKYLSFVEKTRLLREDVDEKEEN